MDIDRVRQLVRELHRELGLDADQLPKKKVVAETRYEPGPDDGQWQIDLDEDGVELRRALIPNLKIGHGLEPTGGI